jgi:hypothetical protein
MAKRKQRPPELIRGMYGGIPHAVWIAAFIASDKAKSLLFALIRQTNGSNGHHLTDKWLAKARLTSSTNQKHS